MVGIEIEEALQFVRDVELGAQPTLEGPETSAQPELNSAKSQALIVGSEIVSFVKGVTEERRHDIVNSTLLAQLVANKRVPVREALEDWYRVYFEVLENTGWVVQAKQFNRHVEQSQGFEAHQAIIAIATSLLGPGAAALQVIMTTLDALKSMQQNSPWITLFNRESRHASAARFQVTLAQPGEDEDFIVALLAFALQADAELTQVLFFKFQSNSVNLKYSSGKVTANEAVLAAIRDPVQQKLAGFAQSFVRELPDLD
ncbi:hypothetical protein ACVMII_005391 [Bradyrhizobium diazoefficiens]